MIRQQIVLDKYDDWEVDVYYGVTHFDVGEIMERLNQIGCDGRTAYLAYQNLSSKGLNTGLTYSNFGTKQSVMVIGIADSSKQFINTLCHEQFHLSAHIGKVYFMDMYGEEICYLMGHIAQEMFKVSRKFICECCRKKDSYEKEEKRQDF